MNKIYVLTQYHGYSLSEHVNTAYSSRAQNIGRYERGFVDILAANQTSKYSDWSTGSADAVRRHLWSGAISTR